MKREWLIRKRESKGLTQLQLASLCNISNQTISNIESGRRHPSGKVALRIAEVLKFDMRLFYDKESA